jgi:hypothetical protein
VTLGIHAKELNLGLIRPENLVSHGLSPSGAFCQCSSQWQPGTCPRSRDHNSL